MYPAIAATRKVDASVFVWAGVSLFSLGIMSLVVVAPLAQAHNHPQFSSGIYHLFSFVCHQLPERSFHFGAHQFAVCSRCTGLYGGFALAALCYPFTRSLTRTDTPSRFWLFAAVSPLVIDFSVSYFGIWENTHLTRVTTGALLGAVAVFYIMPGLVQLSQAFVHRLRR